MYCSLELLQNRNVTALRNIVTPLVLPHISEQVYRFHSKVSEGQDSLVIDAECKTQTSIF